MEATKKDWNNDAEEDDFSIKNNGKQRMKTYLINSSSDNIKECFIKDSIKRNKLVMHAWNIICNVDNGCLVSIDGAWGTGKTFFIKQLQMVFDYIHISKASDEVRETDNNPIQEKSKEKETIENLVNNSALFREARSENERSVRTVYYDAWMNDSYDDPVLSLAFTVIDQLQLKERISGEGNLKGIVTDIIDTCTRTGLFQSLEKHKPEDYLAEIEKSRKRKDAISSFFGHLHKEVANRIVIFIDELDRCRPDFAVRLLEGIKHYYVDTNIVFVLAINAEELQKTICHFYGAEFDATRYLDRFFDLRLSLPPVRNEDYFASIGYHEDALVDDVCRAVINRFHMSMREISRFLSIVRLAVYKPTHRESSEPDPIRAAINVCLHYLAPIAIGLRMCNIEGYRDFVSGEGEAYLEMVFDSEWAVDGLRWLGDRPKNPIVPGETDESWRKDRLIKMYRYVFPGNTRNPRPLNLGECTFEQGVIDVVHEAIAGLSFFTLVEG